MTWHVRLKLDPHDLWVGVFWRLEPSGARRHFQAWNFYICLLPMVVVHIFQGLTFAEGQKTEEKP